MIHGFFERLLKWFSKDAIGPVDVLLVGIGNIGSTYDGTRHNAGFLSADLLWEKLGKPPKTKLNGIVVAKGVSASSKNVLIVWPQTFVNRSGDAVSYLCSQYSIKAEMVFVMVDDFTLPVGSLRLRAKGSDGGHNGLKSIIASVGDQFPRIRIGIGPLPQGVNIIDFVLGRFSENELVALQNALHKSVVVFEMCLNEGLQKALNSYNQIK